MFLNMLIWYLILTKFLTSSVDPNSFGQSKIWNLWTFACLYFESQFKAATWCRTACFWVAVTCEGRQDDGRSEALISKEGKPPFGALVLPCNWGTSVIAIGMIGIGTQFVQTFGSLCPPKSWCPPYLALKGLAGGVLKLSKVIKKNHSAVK